ncbi:MAG: ATP-binding protein [Chitinophagaceae bacterium]
MKIRKKLLLVFIGLASLVALVGYFAIAGLKEISKDVTQIRQSSIPEVESSTEMAFELMQLNGLFNEYAHHANKNRRAETDKIKIELKEGFARFEKALASRKGITASGLTLYDGKELQQELEELEETKELENKYILYKKDVSKIITYYEVNRYVADYILHEDELEERGRDLIEELKLFKNDAQAEINYETLAVEKEAKFSTRFLIAIAGIAFVIAIIAGILVSGSIVTPILKLKAATQGIDGGIMDIIKGINGDDEIGDLAISFNKMTRDLKRSKMQIEEHTKTLEQKVHERTNELEMYIRKLKKTEEKLRHYAYDLKNSNTELEQFAYVASHDLQEPLRTISSFVKLIQQQYKGKLDEKADKYLGFITQSSGRMEVLIKDLLDFSRIGHKKELEKVDCNEILQDVLTDLSASIMETQATTESASLPVINGYPTEVKQLFQNLIANAIKFRKKDSIPKIKVAIYDMDRYWKFGISDNGIGIEKQHSERIFIIFQRLHTRTEYKGSGIGLSHCKKIAALHKGKIWVESIKGEGSTFYFTIEKS